MTFQTNIIPIPIASSKHRNAMDSYASHNKSKSTEHVYNAAWQKFTEWCDEHGYQLTHNLEELANIVGCFLADMASSGNLTVASLSTYLPGIKDHVRIEFGLELEHPNLKKVIHGIKRAHRAPQTKKRGLLAEDLKAILPRADSSVLADVRDRSLLLLGFSAGLRRSELVGIDVEHLELCRQGLSICIPYSKTDQLGTGQHVEVPRKPHSNNCPVVALERWLAASAITSGPVFRGVNRHGQLAEARLTGTAVALIIKKHGALLFDASNLSGHSLRRGFVLDALASGASEAAVINTTRQVPSTLRHYASEKKNWRVNALHKIDL